MSPSLAAIVCASHAVRHPELNRILRRRCVINSKIDCTSNNYRLLPGRPMRLAPTRGVLPARRKRTKITMDFSVRNQHPVSSYIVEKNPHIANPSPKHLAKIIADTAVYPPYSGKPAWAGRMRSGCLPAAVALLLTIGAVTLIQSRAT